MDAYEQWVITSGIQRMSIVKGAYLGQQWVGTYLFRGCLALEVCDYWVLLATTIIKERKS